MEATLKANDALSELYRAITGADRPNLDDTWVPVSRLADVLKIHKSTALRHVRRLSVGGSVELKTIRPEGKGGSAAIFCRFVDPQLQKKFKSLLTPDASCDQHNTHGTDPIDRFESRLRTPGKRRSSRGGR